MNKRILSFVLVASCLLLCFISFQPVESQVTSLGFIFIRPDGIVEPSSTPIERVGNVFTFTGNIYDPIIIERDNVVLDGAGLYLQSNRTSSAVGRDNGVGINVTSSNVTIMNIHILNWTAGILGAYNDNTIISNFITNCDDGIKIYGSNYNVAGNYIANNDEGILLSASHAVVSRNKLIDNGVGISIRYYSHIIKENNMSNAAHDISMLGVDVTIYRNNFFKTDPNGYVIAAESGGTWDNGVEGNFWSAYNGTDANLDGIGDEPYFIGTTWGHDFGVDNYPLMKPVIIQEPPQPLPSPSPSPTSTPTPTPMPTPAATPTPAPTQTPQPPTPTAKPTSTFSASPQQTTSEPEQPTIPCYPIVAVIAAIIITATVITAFALRKRRATAN
jgi:hypothetical protein